MKYDFDTIIDRRHTDCLKWDENELIYGTADLHPMWVADMDFKIPPQIMDAMRKRLEHGVFGYTFRGDAYHHSIVNWVGRRYHWNIEQSWISFSPGVVPALAMSVLGNTIPGDRVLIMTPVYGPFFSVVRNNGRILTEHPLTRHDDGSCSIDFEKLESQIDGRTRMLLLCSPHNPVGRVWTREELERLVELAVRHDLIIVSDEIHADFIYSGFEHISIASLSEEAAARTITCYAPSKTFGLAGLSTSYVVIPNEKLRNNFNHMLAALEVDGGNIFGSTALTAAYDECEDWLEELLTYLEANRDYACKFFEERIPRIKVKKPDATYLLWLNCEELGFADAGALDRFFIDKAKLGLNRGIRFGSQCGGYMRLNIGCPRALLTKGLEQLEAAVNSL